MRYQANFKWGADGEFSDGDEWANELIKVAVTCGGVGIRDYSDDGNRFLEPHEVPDDDVVLVWNIDDLGDAWLECKLSECLEYLLPDGLSMTCRHYGDSWRHKKVAKALRYLADKVEAAGVLEEQLEQEYQQKYGKEAA